MGWVQINLVLWRDHWRPCFLLSDVPSDPSILDKSLSLLGSVSGQTGDNGFLGSALLRAVRLACSWQGGVWGWWCLLKVFIVQEAGLFCHLLFEYRINDLQISTKCIFTDVFLEPRACGILPRYLLSTECQEVTSWMLTMNRKALGGSMWYGFELHCDEHSNKGLETGVKR